MEQQGGGGVDVGSNTYSAGCTHASEDWRMSMMGATDQGRRSTTFAENKTWKLKSLRKKFKVRDMESKYQLYQKRLQHAQFVVYLLMQTAISLGSLIFSLTYHPKSTYIHTDNQHEEEALSHMAVHAAVTLVSASLMAYVYKEASFRTRPLLHFLASAIVFVTLESMQVVLLYLSKIDYTTTCTATTHTATTHIATTHTVLAKISGGHETESSAAQLQDWSFYTVIVCYIFLPLPTKFQAFVLAMIVSVAQLTLVAVQNYFFDEDRAINRLLADMLMIACANGLGLYYRIMFEIAIRRSFLDKRASIYYTMRLNQEKKKEVKTLMISAQKHSNGQENLLKSILPTHLSERVKTDLRESLKSPELETFVGRDPFSKAYFEKHSNVSILFADIVNFTPLTTSMEVGDLVAMLDELFGKFDEAAEKYKCLRIKILGDCYYCVCGVPKSIEKHGIMDERKADVDMRIGINSGSVFSGILGKKKWQYDVWGTDVTIANHMEQAGEPGCVHLTHATKVLCSTGNQLPASLLRPGHQDPYLQSHKVTTYLLPASDEAIQAANHAFESERKSWLQGKSAVMRKVARSSMGQHSDMSANPRTYSVSYDGNALSSSRRQTANVEPALSEFQSITNKVDVYMKQAVEGMPIAKMDQWFKPDNVHPLFLTFHGMENEVPFTVQENPTVKFSFFAATSVFLITGLVHFLVINVRTVSVIWSVGMAVLVTVTLLSWAEELWHWAFNRDHYDDSDDEMDDNHGTHNSQSAGNRTGSGISWTPKTWLHWISQCFVKNFQLRVAGFVLICIFTCLTSNLPLHYCMSIEVEGNKTSSSPTQPSAAGGFPEYGRGVQCSYPTYSSRMLILSLATTFVFYRGHFFMKLLTMLTNFVTFAILVVHERSDLFIDPRSGKNMGPSHLQMLMIIMIAFHVIDRQTEYLFRLDFVWKKDLNHDLEQAEVTKKVNGFLLRNILPQHVGNCVSALGTQKVGTPLNTEKYLNAGSQMTEDAAPPSHHEEYRNVAVMFASIPDFYLDAAKGPDEDNNNKTAQSSSYTGNEVFAKEVEFQPDNKLTLLNQLICTFDDVLMCGDESFEAVEKIKVTGATYMAAVGLETVRKSSGSSGSRPGRSSVLMDSHLIHHHHHLHGTYNKRSRSSDQVTHSSSQYRDSVDSLGMSESELKAAENAKTMVHFAVKLQQQLKKFNDSTCQQFKLRVGELCL
ncbi:unnamed protein product, partial [Notodromas monacha]